MITTIQNEEFFNKKKSKESILVVTHDGLFHSDEVFAIALLQIFYKNIDIIRTSDSTIITNAINDKNIYVLDVGTEYKPNMLNFDHHNNNSNEATVSMIFNYLFAEKDREMSMQIVYDRLIKGVNDWDMGIANRESAILQLPQIISGFNRINTPTQNTQFLKAIEFAYTILSNEINTANEFIKAKDIWQKKQMLNKHTAILNEHCSLWRVIAANTNNIKYIMQPDNSSWSVVSVDSKHFPLPVPIDDNDVIFYHNNRFIVKFKTLQSALNYTSKHLS